MMKREFVVERQGKTFVLYAGLLDMAHEIGLRSIATEMLQAPDAANENVAICRATVVMGGATDRVFMGIGDASYANVPPAMQTCLLRMAETRAKARALRDAVNVGVAALEELGDSADATDNAPRPRSGRRSSTPAVRRAVERRPAPAPTEAATAQQQRAVTSLCSKRGLDPVALALERFNVDSVASLTGQQACELIRSLNDQRRVQERALAA